jgi:hypothetical protein
VKGSFCSDENGGEGKGIGPEDNDRVLMAGEVTPGITVRSWVLTRLRRM